MLNKLKELERVGVCVHDLETLESWPAWRVLGCACEVLQVPDYGFIARAYCGRWHRVTEDVFNQHVLRVRNEATRRKYNLPVYDVPAPMKQADRFWYHYFAQGYRF